MDSIRGPDYELAEKDYMLGMKYKDIAEKYNVSINTVKSWKQRYNWNRKGVHTKKEKVCTQNKKKSAVISWIDIENEYVTDIRKKPCTLESLCKKYNIPIQTIKDMSAKYSWSKKRTEYKLNTNQKILDKTIEKVSEKESDRKARIISVGDKILDKLEEAVTQLDLYIVMNKKKTKTVEYNNGLKPIKEVIVEEEIKEIVDGIIDKKGIKDLTGALKDIKDIQIEKDESENNKQLINEHAERVKKALENR